MPKEALETVLSPAEWEVVTAAAPVSPLKTRLVPATLFCGVLALLAAAAVWSGLAVAPGACVVSGVLRKLSQAKSRRRQSAPSGI